jgi:hypothetical protein
VVGEAPGLLRRQRVVLLRGRPERERAQVRELLRCLGVPFTEDDLSVPPKDDDVDVLFRKARFQNIERTEPGRRRHEEVRALAEGARIARDARALEMPRRDSVPMGVHELLREVLKALDAKTRKTTNRAALDAVVYMNLRGRHLSPAPEVASPSPATSRSAGSYSPRAPCAT